MSQSIRVTSEDEAWVIFENAINEKIETDFVFNFDGWPHVKIKLCGDEYDQSLTAKDMMGIVEIQKTIFQSYALIKYGSSNIRKLTDLEKRNLTVHFKIKEGSSDVLAALAEPLRIIAAEVATKMEPSHVIITVLGAGILWSGTTITKAILQYRKDKFIEEQETKRKKTDIDDRQFTSDQETRRLELFTASFKTEPKLERIQEIVEESMESLLKNLSDAETISLSNVDNIKGSTIKAIFKNPAKKSIEDRLDGLFRITKVNVSNPDYIQFHLRDTKSGEDFSAKINDTDIIQKRIRNVLQEAEYSKTPVLMQMNIKRKRGQIVSATILKAESPSEDFIHLFNDGSEGIRVKYDDKKGFVWIETKK